jgi:hypothetical protein
MAASKLYINDGKVDVAIAELAIISGKQQAVLGDFERDLILRTSGNIQIQVGNKFYPLNFTTSNGSSTSTVISSTTTILNTFSDLASLAYPGDGNYVFIRDTKAFYIAADSSYVRINNLSTPSGPTTPTQPTQTVYLSYDEVQSLTGVQKLRVILNTGYLISSISDISSYTPSDVYLNQVVFAQNEQRHYKLIDVNNPSLAESWKEIYLNLQDGGNVFGPVTISVDGDTSKSLSALHISSNYASKASIDGESTLPIFSVGAKDYSSGLALWNNDGNVYLRSLAKNSAKGFNFLTTIEDGTVLNPLQIAKNSVGIGGSIDYGYSLSVTYDALFKNNITLNNNFRSPDYLTGDSGVGFGLTKDSGNLWTLEVDQLIVRKQHTNLNSNYITSGINGAQLYNYTITIKEADFVQSIPIYIKAAVSGKYSDTAGTVRPLSARASKVKVLRIPIANLSVDSATNSYDTITLSYAIGDILTDGSTDSIVTYNRAADGSYYTPAGQYSYDSGSSQFISNPSGDLININEISVYFVTSTSMNSISVGDLLYYKSWNEDKGFQDAIHAEVVSVVDDGYYIYVYDAAMVTSGTQLIKVGNSVSGLAFMQNNAADIGNPFTELLSNVTSFREFYENYYYEQGTDYPETDNLVEDSWSSKANTRVRIGDLSNVLDTDLQLTTQQYGLYSDNAYLKGNFVLNSAKFNNISSDTSYSPFLMLKGDGSLRQIDLTSKIAQWDAGQPQVQSDWNQVNNASPDYIKNKPTFGSAAFASISDFKASSYIPSWTELTDKPSIPDSLSYFRDISLTNIGAITFPGSNSPAGNRLFIARNFSNGFDEVDYFSIPGTAPFAIGGHYFYTYNPDAGSSGGMQFNFGTFGNNNSFVTGGSIIPKVVNPTTAVSGVYVFDSIDYQLRYRGLADLASDLGVAAGVTDLDVLRPFKTDTTSSSYVIDNEYIASSKTRIVLNTPSTNSTLLMPSDTSWEGRIINIVNQSTSTTPSWTLVGAGVYAADGSNLTILAAQKSYLLTYSDSSWNIISVC